MGDNIQCLAFNPVTHHLLSCSSVDIGMYHMCTHTQHTHTHTYRCTHTNIPSHTSDRGNTIDALKGNMHNKYFILLLGLWCGEQSSVVRHRITSRATCCRCPTSFYYSNSTIIVHSLAGPVMAITLLLACLMVPSVLELRYALCFFLCSVCVCVCVCVCACMCVCTCTCRA